MSSSADQYASPAYDIPRHSRANSRASLKSEQLPSYHAEQAEEAVDQESVEQKLLEQEKAEKEIGRAALDVDGFRFEVRRSFAPSEGGRAHLVRFLRLSESFTS